MPFSLQFRLSFLFSPPQSSCQPATSSGAATAASWRETAPSVSVLTALRSARTGRAAEVGFSCTSWEQWGGGLLPWSTPPHVSLCPQPDFHQMNKQEVLGVREPSVCRQGLMYSTLHADTGHSLSLARSLRLSITGVHLLKHCTITVAILRYLNFTRVFPSSTLL